MSEEPVVVPTQAGMSLAMGALSGLLVAASALVIGIVPWFEVAPALLSVLVVLGLAYLYLKSLSASTLGPRGRLAAALALVGFAPVIGHAAERSLMLPLLSGSAPAMVDAVGVVLVALLCLSTASAVAWWWASRRRAPRGRFVHYLALASVASCAGLVACAAADASHTPPPETYAESLPVVATLDVAMNSQGFSEVRPARGDVSSSGYAIGRTCLTGRCFAHVRHFDRVQPIGPLLPQGAALALHHDELAGSVVLAADGKAVATMNASLAGWDWVVPSPAALAAQLSPPRSFIALAVIALLGAVLVLAWRRRLSARLSSVSQGRVGVVDESGWAHLDDGTPPWRIQGDVACGPVVMVEEAFAPAAAYRGARRERRVVIHRGPRRAAIARLRLAVATADAAVCSWVIALSAPLIVAALVGLLG
jgi:hypothetical protein